MTAQQSYSGFSRPANLKQKLQDFVDGKTADASAVQPPFPWVGGKSRLIEKIQRNSRIHFTSYHEPFLGGGAVAVDILKRKEVFPLYLSDLNTELVQAWKAIKDTPEELLTAFRSHYRTPDSKYFHAVRNWDRDKDFLSLPTADRGARFLYLIRSTYRGAWTETREGYCSASYTPPRRPDFEEYEARIRALSILLHSRPVFISQGSFVSELASAGFGSFVYLDPPYATDVEAVDLGQQTRHSAYTAAQKEEAVLYKELAQSVADLTARGAYVLLSNTETPTTRSLFGHMAATTSAVQWNLSSNNQRRNYDADLFDTPVSAADTEVLWANQLLATALKASAAAKGKSLLLS